MSFLDILAKILSPFKIKSTIGAANRPVETKGDASPVATEHSTITMATEQGTVIQAGRDIHLESQRSDEGIGGPIEVSAVPGEAPPWYVLGNNETPGLLVHCFARFTNKGNAPWSEVEAHVQVEHDQGKITGFQFLPPRTTDFAYLGRNGERRTTHLLTKAKYRRLEGRAEIIEVQPHAPHDREIFALCQAVIPRGSRSLCLKLTAVDQNGRESSWTVELRHLDEIPIEGKAGGAA